MKARVPLYRTSPVRSVIVDTEATKGAIVGTNLYNQDGTLFDPSQAAPQPNAPAADLTTDDVAEGGSLYFTDERAQDAVGTILSGAGDVPLAYDDAGKVISAALSQARQDQLSLLSAIAPDLRTSDAGAYRVTASGAYRITA